MIMKPHQISPYKLAVILDGAVDPQEFVEDMRAFPELYLPDHVAICREKGLLPLSEQAWRHACLRA